MIVTLPLNHIHLRISEIETTIVAAVPHLSPIRLCPILVLLLITIDITHQPQDTTREETRTTSLEQSLTQPSIYPTALTGKAVFASAAVDKFEDLAKRVSKILF